MFYKVSPKLFTSVSFTFQHSPSRRYLHQGAAIKNADDNNVTNVFITTPLSNDESFFGTKLKFSVLTGLISAREAHSRFNIKNL